LKRSTSAIVHHRGEEAIQRIFHKFHGSLPRIGSAAIAPVDLPHRVAKKDAFAAGIVLCRGIALAGIDLLQYRRPQKQNAPAST
jgi:hypothetical protein